MPGLGGPPPLPSITQSKHTMPLHRGDRQWSASPHGTTQQNNTCRDTCQHSSSRRRYKGGASSGVVESVRGIHPAIGSGQVFVNTPPPRAGAYQSRHVRGPSPRTHQVSLYVCQHARSRTNLVRSHGGVLSTLGHSKRRETREDACEGEARGCWAVRPRTSGGCRDGFFLRDFFDKPSRLRYA